MVNMSPDFFVLSPICKPSGEARCFTIWGNVKTKKMLLADTHLSLTSQCW